jgi:hypothetical protein
MAAVVYGKSKLAKSWSDARPVRIILDKVITYA